MKTFKEILQESRKSKIFIIDGSLWVAYSEGSGISIPMGNKTYFTNKKGDSNFDNNLMIKLIEFANTTKPVKSKGNSKLYNLPIYSKVFKGNNTSSVADQGNLDIWGGDQTPERMGAIIIDTNDRISVATIFKTKKEASKWLSSMNK